jgi:chromosome segregation ATPase
MARSKKKPTIIFLAIFLCSVLSLTGCKDTEKENAIAEAAAAKEELIKVKADLANIMSERDNLKLELTAVTEARDKLQAAVGQAANIKEQLAGLTEERDTAIAKAAEAQSIVENLKSQLAEQIQKVTGLEGQNKKLQEMIDELKKNLGGKVEIPSLPKL